MPHKKKANISADMCAVLEEHANDSHHRETSVCQLGRQLFRLLSRVAGRQDLEAEVARCGWGAGRLVLRNLAEGHVGKNLTPTCGRNLGNRSEAVGDVRKFKASAWGKIPRELARDPCRNTSQDLELLKHRSQHFMHTYDTYAHHLNKHHFSPTSCSGVIYPIVASMEIRPCFSSVWRRRLKFSTLPSAVNPAGSQNPTGSCTPSSFSKARRGEAV